MNKWIDLYEKRREEREGKLRDFFDPHGQTRFLVVPRVVNRVFTSCSSIPTILRNNLDYLESQLALEFCDDLPFLEPWIGVGVYATAFGASYLWDAGGAPDTLVRYRDIEEIFHLPPPDWRKSEIMVQVVDAIDAMKEKTKGRIPICLTDTQSAQDTATLILDTVEFFTGCYTHPREIGEFLDTINTLIVDFSRVQIEHIGKELLASPGHGFHGLPFLSGIGVSDDNMVISSPDLNEKFTFPRNEELGREFGGLALHSCGDWTPTMARVGNIDGLDMIDFALRGHPTDAAPCTGEAVRSAVKGTEIILKARIGEDMAVAFSELEAMIDGTHKVVVEFLVDGLDPEDRYKRIEEKLASIFENS